MHRDNPCFRFVVGRPAVAAGMLLAAAGLGGCAASGSDLDSLTDNVTRLQAEARSLAAGPESDLGLEASRSLSTRAAGEKGSAAEQSLLEAQAAARASLAASVTQRYAAEADSLRRVAADAQRQWQDALRMLEQTEKVAGREARGVNRAAPAAGPSISLPAIPAPPSDSLQDPAALLETANPWKTAAGGLGVPAADVYGRLLDAVSAAQAPKIKPEPRARHIRAATWSLRELSHRVQAESLRREGQDALGRSLAFAAQRDQALWAMVDLERGMKDTARSDLEEERARQADREQKLYESLKQFEGKFASIRREARGTIMSLPDILFDFGKSELRREAELNVAKLSVILQQFPEMHITVEGHTDNVGSEEYNLKLSEKRAKSVLDFLVREGVTAERMELKGYGMSQPVASNETAEGRQQNRRVDLVIREE